MDNVNAVFFMGNGVMQTFKMDSWKGMIEKVAHKYHLGTAEIKAIEKLPANMQIIAATKDHVDDAMKEFADDLRKLEYSTEMQKFICNQVLTLPVSDIITTNYTYEIEKSISPQYSTTPGNRARKTIMRGNRRENQFMVYRYNQIDEKRIWHIHGEACTVSGIVMGNYYYGKLLHTIQEYIAKRMGYLHICQKESKEIKEANWIDLFLTKDVYVMGFGMDLSEIDFWWLACCKRRNFPETNIYVYEPNLAKDNVKRIMAETYGIKLMCPDERVGNGEFLKFYEDVLARIRKIEGTK